MGEQKICLKCGRVIDKEQLTDGTICEECRQSERETFQIVRQYLRDHPGANAMEIANETRVSIDKIMNYIREGKLM